MGLKFIYIMALKNFGTKSLLFKDTIIDNAQASFMAARAEKNKAEGMKMASKQN